jgi:hypothetical protein
VTCQKYTSIFNHVNLHVCIPSYNEWNLMIFSFLLSDGAKPYFLETTHLTCMLRTGIGLAIAFIAGRKKRALQVKEIDMSHSYIYYDGVLFEFGLNGTRIEPQGLPMFSKTCPSAYLPLPAGFSHLSVDCVVKCAKNYHIRFGNYKVFTNNCNTFTNRLSDLLCHEIHCPSWCLKH